MMTKPSPPLKAPHFFAAVTVLFWEAFLCWKQHHAFRQRLYSLKDVWSPDSGGSIPCKDCVFTANVNLALFGLVLYVACAEGSPGKALPCHCMIDKRAAMADLHLKGKLRSEGHQQV